MQSRQKWDAQEVCIRDKWPEPSSLDGRNLYIYFPNGLARPNLSWTAVAKSLNTTGTARNWNTVTKLLELAERLKAVK